MCGETKKNDVQEAAWQETLCFHTLGDGALTWDLNGNLLETLDILDLINDRHQDLQTGF